MQSAWLCVSMGDGERDVMKATASETTAEAGWSKGPYRAPRGPEISCKGWQQEAAMRMLLNNLDPEVAEKPEDLRSEEHTSELQSRLHLVCRLLLEKKKKIDNSDLRDYNEPQTR